MSWLYVPCWLCSVLPCAQQTQGQIHWDVCSRSRRAAVDVIVLTPAIYGYRQQAGYTRYLHSSTEVEIGGAVPDRKQSVQPASTPKKAKKKKNSAMSDLGLPTMRRGREEAPPITPPPLVRAICSANYSQGSGAVLP